MKTPPVAAAALSALVLSGCGAALPRMAPPAEGTCWARDETPAVIETVTEQVMVQPAEILADGTVVRPAAYRTETRQRIVKPRKDTWFEIPCEDQMTPDFIASLQRALKARGIYRGAVTGKMDGRTRAAIRAYQKPQGLDSGVISLAAARQMGLAVADLGIARHDPPAAPAIAEPMEDAARKALSDAETQAETRTGPEAQTARRTEDQPAEQAARAEAERRATQEQARADAARAEAAAEAAQRAAEKAARAEAERKARAEAERKARAEAARREAELAAALEAERKARKRKPQPLPISMETY